MVARTHDKCLIVAEQKTGISFVLVKMLVLGSQPRIASMHFVVRMLMHCIPPHLRRIGAHLLFTGEQDRAS